MPDSLVGLTEEVKEHQERRVQVVGVEREGLLLTGGSPEPPGEADELPVEDEEDREGNLSEGLVRAEPDAPALAVTAGLVREGDFSARQPVVHSAHEDEVVKNPPRGVVAEPNAVLTTLVVREHHLEG